MKTGAFFVVLALVPSLVNSLGRHCDNAMEFCQPGCQAKDSAPDSLPLMSAPETSASQLPSTVISELPSPAVGVTIHTKCKRNGRLAITWDDGPDANTGEILKLFREAKVKTSHFINGNNRANLSDPNNYGVGLVKQMFEAGHTVGTHMWKHIRIEKLNKRQLEKQLCLNDKYIGQIIGVTPRFFRAPFLNLPKVHAGWIASWGYQIVHFNLNPEDWRHKNGTMTQEVFRNALDIDQSSASFISNTHEQVHSSVEVMPAILNSDYIKRWKLVTVGECMGYPEPSEWYRENPWGKNGLPSC